MREFGLLAIIALLFVVMSFASPYFLTWGNLRAILLSFSIEGIVVIGMTILLIVGGIDLSVGSVVCLSMVIGGTLFLAGLDPWTASLIAIAACGFIGFLMGLCVTRIGLHFFIVSLAFMVITRGLSLLFTQGTPQSLFSLPPAFKFVGQGSLGGVPFVIVIFVVLIALFDVLLAPLGDLPARLLHRQQREGGAALGHRHQAHEGDVRHDLLARSRASPA